MPTVPTLKSRIKALMPDRWLMHAQALDHFLHGEPELRLLPRLCSRNRDAVDAGANIGTYTYFLRRHARRVFAYEPNPGLAARLKQRFPDVQVRNLALSDREGEVQLQVPVDENGRDRHELGSIAQNFSGSRNEFRIRSITLDGEKLDNVGFLKVDVEQHELQVLAGALGTIRRCRPVVMSECTPLKYRSGLKSAFSPVLQENYVGWCSFGKQWLPLDHLVPEQHLDPARFGTPGGYIGSNIIMFPAEHPLSSRGPLA